jgi:hypothetical protein
LVRRIDLAEEERHTGLLAEEELQIGQEEERSLAVVVAPHIGLVLEVGTGLAAEGRCTGLAAARHILKAAAVRSLAGHTDLEEGHVLEVRHIGWEAAHHRGQEVAAGHILVPGSHPAAHRTVDSASVAVAGNFAVEVVDIAQAVRILEGLLEDISRRSASAPSVAISTKDA